MIKKYAGVSVCPNVTIYNNLSDRMHKVFILYSGVFDIIVSLNKTLLCKELVNTQAPGTHSLQSAWIALCNLLHPLFTDLH